MKWKYALILSDETADFPDGHKPSCFLAEVYDLDNDGHYESFCEAEIENVQDFKHAYEDIIKDGVNIWFYQNGNFSKTATGWDWQPMYQSY
jgi:hypothetical protein